MPQHNSLRDCIKEDCIENNWNIEIMEKIINRFFHNCGREIIEKRGCEGFWYIELKKVSEKVLYKKIKYYWCPILKIVIDKNKFFTLFIISPKTKKSMTISLPYNVANEDNTHIRKNSTCCEIELFKGICPVCEDIDKSVKKCQCGKISYCSKKCQKIDWKNHRQICDIIVK